MTMQLESKIRERVDGTNASCKFEVCKSRAELVTWTNRCLESSCQCKWGTFNPFSLTVNDLIMTAEDPLRTCWSRQEKQRADTQQILENINKKDNDSETDINK